MYYINMELSFCHLSQRPICLNERIVFIEKVVLSKANSHS
jgi:hypothetical protein